MWTIFKVFVEFVMRLLRLYVFWVVFCLVWFGVFLALTHVGS